MSTFITTNITTITIIITTTSDQHDTSYIDVDNRYRAVAYALTTIGRLM
jgi:hypothetical protein